MSLVDVRSIPTISEATVSGPHLEAEKKKKEDPKSFREIIENLGNKFSDTSIDNEEDQFKSPVETPRKHPNASICSSGGSVFDFLGFTDNRPQHEDNHSDPRYLERYGNNHPFHSEIPHANLRPYVPPRSEPRRQHLHGERHPEVSGSVHSHPFRIQSVANTPPQPDHIAQLYATNQAMLKYMVTNDLTKDSIQVFDGKSSQFWAWIDQITSKLGVIQSTPSEIVHIMRSKSSGGPQVLIDSYVSAVSVPGEAGKVAFGKLWSTLIERYGSTTRIYDEIMGRFDDLPMIHQKNMEVALQSLFDVCEIAQSNRTRAPDLQFLDK